MDYQFRSSGVGNFLGMIMIVNQLVTVIVQVSPKTNQILVNQKQKEQFVSFLPGHGYH